MAVEVEARVLLVLMVDYSDLDVSKGVHSSVLLVATWGCPSVFV